MSADIEAIVLTLKLASVSTFVLLLIGTPFAWWLAHSRARFKFLIEAVVALPLVLPPTVLGFYLLIALGAGQLPGGGTLAFTFTGLVIGSVIYSLPFVVQPLRDAFAAIGRQPLEIAATLGASPWQAFFRVALPMARPGFLTATVLAFAHTMGEFGVVLMIGGNIPGETRVASVAIYENVESLNFAGAHALSVALLLLSFGLLALVYAVNRRARVISG
ncbi:MAG: molybdate ABC transporter permease subunit [Gammaproteobacteria bacterium]|nr:molybdate ABC transporter permease subunit [Gammaproteobacteria bacterium]